MSDRNRAAASELEQLLSEPDVLDADVRADGALVAEVQLLTGWRLTLRRPGGLAGTYDECWDYPPAQLGGAMAAALAAGVGFLALLEGREPEGWYRHLPSNRRRPMGDPAREEIRA